MPLKTIPFFFFLLMNAGFLMLSADEKDSPASPEPVKKSRYFQESGSQVDSLVDRIRFKISYSWEKSAEYFRLACSAVTDTLPAKARDIKARADSKKDELLEKGRQTVRETTQQTMQDLSRKGEELKQDLNQMGREVKDEAAKEVRENTDKYFK